MRQHLAHVQDLSEVYPLLAEPVAWDSEMPWLAAKAACCRHLAESKMHGCCLKAQRLVVYLLQISVEYSLREVRDCSHYMYLASEYDHIETYNI